MWSRSRRHLRKPAQRPRLCLESLEERTLLYASTSSLAIPDVATITSTINVPDSYIIGDINVTIDLDHTYDDDLDVFLIGPDGTRVELFTDVGGSGNNFRNTTLDDEASVSITAGAAPFTGVFRPEGSLSAFDGKNVQGIWTLEITDDEPPDSGMLNSWQLTVSYPSTDIPKTINNLATITSTITVSDSFTIGDLDVAFDITHAFDEDLDIFLIGPDGTRVELVTDVVGVNFRNTILDDEATTAITAGTTPFTGRFRPEGFLNAFDGKSVNGVWTLEITDDFFLDAGTLNSWSLSFEAASTVPELLGTAFNVIPSAAQWGNTIGVSYTITNLSPVASGPFDVEVRLSTNNFISTFDTLLQTFTIPGLAGNSSISGILPILLPGSPGNPPPPFSQPDDVFVGIIIDSGGDIAENNEADNLNRGAGLDLDSLTIVNSAEVEGNNTAALANLIAQDALLDASIGVAGDVDYFTFEITEPGFLRASITPLASSLDSYLVLSNVQSALVYQGMPIGGGGLLISSEDQSAGNVNPLINQHLLPGTYYLAVSSNVTGASATGAYTLTTQFTPADNPYEPYVDVQSHLVVGANPTALIRDDFNRDGIFDLATANEGSGDVSVLLGVGDGSFKPQLRFDVQGNPSSVVALDFNGDGRRDLATLDRGTGVMTLLPGVGDGTFAAGSTTTDPAIRSLFPGANSQLYAQADYNRDGNIDEASLVSLNDNGQAPFASYLSLGVGIPVDSQALLDLSMSNYWPVLQFFFPRFVSVNQFLGDNSLITADLNPSNPPRATPQLADLNGDGLDDVLVVSQTGDILVRYARTDQPGAFESPVLINASPKARAATILATGAGARIAALDLQSDTISIYTRNPADGSWQRSAGPATGVLAVRIAAGDLDGDGRNDLVTANAMLGTISVFLTRPDGSLQSFPEIKLGVTVSDVVLSDADGDGDLDVLVTDQASGDVAVLRNRGLPQGSVDFEPEARFRAGAGIYGLVETVSNIANGFIEDQYGLPDAFNHQYFVFSLEETASVATGDFNNDGAVDLVTSNRGTNDFSLLLGKKNGGLAIGSFVDPVTFATGGVAPTAIHIADFNRDARPDIVILNEGTGTATVFLGNGAGGFTTATPFFTAMAGNSPTGLSVAQTNDDNNDGVVNGADLLDLVVGNQFGDVLVLLGNGDGTFRPYQRTDRGIALAVADLDGDGQDDFIYGNESLDHVALQLGGAAPNVFQDQANGVLGPGAIQYVDLNDDSIDDIVVANGGGNSVLVYLGQAGGTFGAKKEFFAGTNPVGITIADVDRDGVRDLVVANQGSNDVSILLGQGQGTSWTTTPGPRLNTGGSAPVATLVRDANKDGRLDILVTNMNSNNVALLPGLGGGFFNDQAPVLTPVGQAPVDILPNPNVAGGFLIVNSGSNSLSSIRFDSQQNQFFNIGTFASGGSTPIAATVSDFNNDGFGDLLVANNGDGVIRLFMGDSLGFSVFGDFSSADLPHPTDLQLSATDALVFYASTEGIDAAIRFELGFAVLDVPLGGGTTTSLQDQTLAIVATLQYGSLASTADIENEASTEVDTLNSFVIGLTVPPGGHLFIDAEEGGDDSSGDAEEDTAVAAGNRLFRFLMNLDEALQQARPTELRTDDVSELLAFGMRVLDRWLTAHSGSEEATESLWRILPEVLLPRSLRLTLPLLEMLPAIWNQARQTAPLREALDGIGAGVMKAIHPFVAPPSTIEREPVNPADRQAPADGSMALGDPAPMLLLTDEEHAYTLDALFIAAAAAGFLHHAAKPPRRNRSIMSAPSPRFPLA